MISEEQYNEALKIAKQYEHENRKFFKFNIAQKLFVKPTEDGWEWYRNYNNINYHFNDYKPMSFYEERADEHGYLEITGLELFDIFRGGIVNGELYFYPASFQLIQDLT